MKYYWSTTLVQCTAAAHLSVSGPAIVDATSESSSCAVQKFNSWSFLGIWSFSWAVQKKQLSDFFVLLEFFAGCTKVKLFSLWAHTQKRVTYSTWIRDLKLSG